MLAPKVGFGEGLGDAFREGIDDARNDTFAFGGFFGG
jgi:hypothetical protein